MKQNTKLSSYPTWPFPALAAIAALLGGCLSATLPAGCSHKSVSNNALFNAMARGSATEITSLLDKDPGLVNLPRSTGETPLYQAAFWGNTQVADILIARGANVNAADDFGRTPLYQAIFYRHKAMVDLLIRKGADINATDHFGGTPLHQALVSDQKEIVNLLKKHGAHE